ncbi:MAG: hypothetical protein E7085_05750 [Parabacteroides distasonis]|nr:hypothetical protein [Parabacteroides distasonis]
MKQQCPKCGNWVEGKKVATFARKVTRGAVKKGSAVATGMAIGSIIPGAGTIIGGALGLAASALMDDSVNEVADLVEDIAFDETEYEFTCPKCGRHWKKKQNSSNASISNYQTYTTSASTSYIENDSRRYTILELIKQCTSNNINEGCSLTYAQINSGKLSRKLQNQFGIRLYEWQINTCKNIKELINLIETKYVCSPVADTIKLKQDEFNKEFNYYLDNIDSIIDTKENVDKYVKSIGNAMSGCDITVKSEYFFLQSICCLDYSLLHENDNSLISLGNYYIDRANALLDDGEYKLVKLMFESLSVKHDAHNVVQVQQNFKLKCPKINMLENTLFKTEYLSELYEKTRFYSLIDSVSALESKENFKSAKECLYLIIQLSDIDYQLLGYAHLIDYCYYEFKGLNVCKELAFIYAEKGYELVDYSNNFNPEISCQSSWLRCLEHIAYAYLEGEGTKQDYKKAFELTTKAANLGGRCSAYNLGEIYELGRGVSQNKVLALEWYEKAFALGLDIAKEKVEQLKTTSSKLKSNQTSNASFSDDEIEYLEEVKACLEEDNEISPKERRLLDRLRIKLNISEGRAKELEGSLKVLQLTEEEREYLEEYKACLDEDGEISPKERRLLDRFRDKLGISEERVLELENSIR